MSQVIESAKLLGPRLGRLQDVPQDLWSDWPAILADKRLVPATLQSGKQRMRFCKDLFRPIGKKLLVEYGLPGRKPVSHLEDAEVCDAPDFTHQRGGWFARRDGNGHMAHRRWALAGNDLSRPMVARGLGARERHGSALVPELQLAVSAIDAQGPLE